MYTYGHTIPFSFHRKVRPMKQKLPGMRHLRRGNMAAEATAIRRAGPAIRTFGPLQKERMPAKASFLFPVFEKGSQNGYQGITKKGLCF